MEERGSELVNTQSEAVRRAARLLVERIASEGRRSPRGILVQMDVTKDHLGALLGLNRPEATRAIDALKRAGVLAMEGSTLVVLDEKRLEELAR